MVAILDGSTPELLAAGHTELLARWLDECGALGVDDPAAILTRVELLIRRGELSEALPLARGLANQLASTDKTRHGPATWLDLVPIFSPRKRSPLLFTSRQETSR